jgi:hypothetical protein
MKNSRLTTGIIIVGIVLIASITGVFYLTENYMPKTAVRHYQIHVNDTFAVKGQG